MNKRERDRGSALFWLVVAIGICYGSLKLSLGELRRPGPGFFSFMAGALLGTFSLLAFFQSFVGLSGDEKQTLLPNPHRVLKMAYVYVALTLYAIGMNYLGFFLATLLFLGFILRGIDPQRWRVVIPVSILSTIVAYAVFQYWLEVQLPTGILGF